MPTVRIPLVGSKKCTNCGEVKDLSLFSKRVASKDGFQSVCNSCKSEYRARNRGRILASAAEYRRTHKEEIAKGIKDWESRNPEKVKERWRRYEMNKKDHRRELRLKRYEENKLEIRKKAKEYIARDKEKWKAISRYHSAMRKALVRGQKIANSYDAEIKEIYEKRPVGFEVDHIVPLKGNGVCGLHVPWNLQYLPAIENRKKSNRYADS